MRAPVIATLSLVSLSLGACATTSKLPTAGSAARPIKAVLTSNASRPVGAVPLPIPLPGQLKPLASKLAAVPKRESARESVIAANHAARIEPSRSGFINAMQVYPFSKGALYQVYTAPGEVTDITLEKGEKLVGSGPVAAGDTVRWIIGKTVSGAGPGARVHVLVKPTEAALATNLVINTDRRTYHLELHSDAKTYMASVSWVYPEDELFAVRGGSDETAAAAPVAAGIDVNALNFRYRIEGDSPPWRPLRAFDDGRQVFIEFPKNVGEGEMPPLWVIGPEGDGELVNYRIERNYMVVDRLFAAAELKLGERHQRVVRIIRTSRLAAK
jgi:P-type conjugative transfer protein TrbG